MAGQGPPKDQIHWEDPLESRAPPNYSVASTTRCNPRLNEEPMITQMARRSTCTLFALLAAAALSTAAEPQTSKPLVILQPLARTAYQTNEWIDLSVLRQSPQALPAGNLALTVAGDDGSKLRFTFALPAVAVNHESMVPGGNAQEHGASAPQRPPAASGPLQDRSGRRRDHGHYGAERLQPRAEDQLPADQLGQRQGRSSLSRARRAWATTCSTAAGAATMRRTSSAPASISWRSVLWAAPIRWTCAANAIGRIPT